MPGIFTKDRIPNMRLVDLNKEPAQVCISNGVERFDEGHGVSEVEDIRREVLNLSVTKDKGEKSGAGTVKKDDPAPLQSQSTEHSEKQPPQNVRDQHSGNFPAGNAQQDKSKLGTPDPSAKGVVR